VNYVWPELFGWPKSFFTAGWVALALQSSGYLAETFRAGIEGVPRGHREAAMSVGMPSWLIFTRIVMPQTLLASAPAIVNQITVIIKSSTLVSVITVADLMFRSQQIVNRYYEPYRDPNGNRCNLYRARLRDLLRRQRPRDAHPPPLRSRGIAPLGEVRTRGSQRMRMIQGALNSTRSLNFSPRFGPCSGVCIFN
jgi:hypothetical protein